MHHPTFPEFIAAIDSMILKFDPDELHILPCDQFVWVAANWRAEQILATYSRPDLAYELLHGNIPLTAPIGMAYDLHASTAALAVFKETWDLAEEDREQDPELGRLILEHCTNWVAAFCSNLDNFKRGPK